MTNQIRLKYNKYGSVLAHHFGFHVLSKTLRRARIAFNPKCLLAKIACVILAGFSFISVPYFDKQIPAWFGP